MQLLEKKDLFQITVTQPLKVHGFLPVKGGVSLLPMLTRVRFLPVSTRSLYEKCH